MGPEDDHDAENSVNNVSKHILLLASRCDLIPERPDTDAILKCLKELDAVYEVSLLLQALRFSRFCNIQFKVNESFVGPCDVEAEGVFSSESGTLEIAANGMYSEDHEIRRAFLGTLAHELTHWVMTDVFKNEGRPYKEGSRDGELYRKILNKIATERHQLHDRFKAVFECYKPPYHESELIVVIPHLLAQFPTPEVTHWSTEGAKQLYEFFRNSVLKEVKVFIQNGNSIIERETISELNNKCGLFQPYIDLGMKFEIGYSDSSGDQLINIMVLLIGSDSPTVTLFRVLYTGRYKKDSALCCTYSNLVTPDGPKIKKCFQKLGECNALVVMCTSDDRNDDKFFYNIEILVRTAEKYVKTLVIIVSLECLEEVESYLMRTRAPLTMKCLSENLTVDTLAASSKTLVLEMGVKFQGRHVELGELFGEKEHSLIDGPFIEKMIDGTELSIGDDQTTSNAYDPDLISINDVVDQERLMSMIANEAQNTQNSNRRVAILIESDSHFRKRNAQLYEKLCHIMGDADISSAFIKNEEELELKPFKHRVVFLESQLNFNYPSLMKRLKRNYPYTVAYCIKEKPDKSLICIAIHYPGISFSRKLINYNEDGSKNLAAISADQFVQTKLISRDCGNDALVLCDRAGTGKSWFLNALIGKFSDTHWVIKIPIKLVKSSIDKLPISDLTDDDVVRFLMFHENINDDIGRRFLKYKIMNSSKYRLLLIFDGLEEMPWTESCTPQQNTEKIINLLKYLTEETCVQVVVAVRPEAKYSLSRVSCQLFRFETLKTTCNGYLSKLCGARINLFSSLIDRDIERIIDQYINITRDFLDNPLHIEMLSEVIVERHRGIKPPFNKNTVESNTFNSLVNLYRTFVNIKYDLYFKRNNMFVLVDEMKQQLDSDFQRLAMFYLFGNKEICKTFLSESKLFLNKHGRLSLNREKVTALFNIGIITQHPSQELEIQFIHRTFSEYFASSLIESWMQESSGKNYKELVVKGVICNSAVTFEMLDVMLKHQSVSNKQLTEYASIMEGEDKLNILKAFDRFAQLKFENTLLLLAECVNKSNELRKITRSEYYLSVIQKHSPYEYPYPLLPVSEFCNEDIIKKLIEIGFNVNHRGPNKRVMMHNLMKRGNLDLAQYVVKKTKTELNVEDDDGINLVHVAASSGNFELIEWLEKIGVEISKLCSSGKSLVDYANEREHWDVGLKIIAKWSNHPVIERNRKLFLHAVCDSGNEDFLKTLLMDGWETEVNNADDEGFTPVLIAVERGHLTVAKLLVERGGDVTAKSRDGYTLIHFAAYSGNPDLVFWCSRFCEDCINNCDNVENETPLHIAAKRGHFPTVKTLVNVGGDLSIVSPDKSSFLHFAAYSGNCELVKWYLDTVMSRQWFNVNSETDERLIPLHVAVEQGHLAIAKLLVDSGGDFTKVSSSGLSFLHFAVTSESHEVVEWCLDIAYKDSINHRDNNGKTPVHLAAEKGLLSIIETLVKRGGDVTVKSNDRSTVLHYMAANGHSGLLKWCLEHYGKLKNYVNCSNKEGKTPYDIANENNNNRSMNVLVGYGGVKKRGYQARVNEVVSDKSQNLRRLQSLNGHSKTKLKSSDHQPLTGLIKDQSSNENSNVMLGGKAENKDLLLDAFKMADEEICQKSSSEENQIQSVSASYTPLYLAVLRGDIAGVQSMVNTVGNLKKSDHFCVDEKRRTALHLAVENQNVHIVQLISSYGSEKKNDLQVYFDCVDEEGKTPLHRSVELNNLEMTQMIVCHGGRVAGEFFDINKRDGLGRTALQIATMRGCSSIRTLLIGYGASF